MGGPWGSLGVPGGSLGAPMSKKNIAHFMEVKVRKIDVSRFRWPYSREDFAFQRNRPLKTSAGVSGILRVPTFTRKKWPSILFFFAIGHLVETKTSGMDFLMCYNFDGHILERILQFSDIDLSKRARARADFCGYPLLPGKSGHRFWKILRSAILSRRNAVAPFTRPEPPSYFGTTFGTLKEPY